ncbi:Putative ribonuclease H protein At1g65750 [Linum perenne]
MHEKLLTNKERKRRHLTDDARCARCGGEESSHHVLWDCPFAVSIWGEKKICTWVAVVNDALNRSSRMAPLGTVKVNASIAWDLGPPGWMVLNTDGSVITSSGAAAAGGLIRDELGRCRLAFSSNVGFYSITRAELRGIATGLKLVCVTPRISEPIFFYIRLRNDGKLTFK